MTVVRVGRIHGHPGADTLEVVDGKITRIGNNGGHAVTVDRPGWVLLPAFRDSHIHPTGLAANASRADVSAVRDLTELSEVLAEWAASTTGPIVAVGFDDERVAERRMPTVSDLDRVTTDRPLVVYRHCSHIGSANQIALDLAGITSSTPDPVGGRIRRDSQGAPTGVLEETALTPLSASLSPLLHSPDSRAVRRVLEHLRRSGLVTVDAMVSAGASMWCSGSDELEVIAALGEDAPVTVNVFVICTDPHELQAAAARLADAGPRVRFAGWKGFADGSLGARTAALRAPYADDPSTAGMVVATNLEVMAATAVKLGGQAAIHAIGDLAVERALAVAATLDSPGSVRIEHASVADPAQVERMAAVGAVASVQPSFVASDAAWLEGRLGRDRAAWAYPFASMLEAGVTVRGGSDAPVESADPLVGIRDAVRERSESLTVEQAIDLYADAPIQLGGAATFVLCDGDPATERAVVREVWQEGVRTV